MSCSMISRSRVTLGRLFLFPVVVGIGVTLLGRGLPAAETVEAVEEAEQPSVLASRDPKRLKDEEYLRLFRLLADTFDQVDRNYVKEVDRRRLMEGAIRGMLSELDPYSGYVSPRQLQSFKTSVENEFGGVGVQVSVEKGQLVVIGPLVGSPAYSAGLMAGDFILEIDGKTTDGITLDEAVRRMQGKVGEPVTMKLKHRHASAPESVTLHRELIRLETVLGDVRQASDEWQWMVDEQRRLGYVRVTAFGRRTADELRKVLEKLTARQMRGLILDLRFNPGGLLSAAIEVSDLFIASGRIVSTEGRNTRPKVWEAHQPGTFEGFPMVVLVNRYSASASEIVAACLQDHGRAVIVGERTWGKGSVQNVMELEDGASLLKLTTADYHRPSGKNIHRFPEATEKDDWGVTPNEGFQLTLSANEMSQLANLRREKDIVRRPQEAPQDPPDASPAVVDRQLQKALEGLVQQLPRAQEDTAVTAPAEPGAKAK
jgi:carboxyl-terminal processing protease